MITLIVALLALAVGIAVTAWFYTKRISKIEKAHEADLIEEFHRSFKAGWDDGILHGSHQERLLQMTRKTASKKE